MIEEKVYTKEFISATIIRWMDKCDTPERIEFLLKFASTRLGEESDEYVNIFLLAETKKALPAFLPSKIEDNNLDIWAADNSK